VIHDGPSTDGTREFMEDIASKHANIKYLESEERGNCWGHQNRAWGLTMVDTPWVSFTNGDNQYCYKFMDYMEKNLDERFLDVVTFVTAHSYFDYKPFYIMFSNSQCDLAQFAVRTQVARTVGFNHRDFAADAHFIEEIKVTYPNYRLKHLHGMCLMTHN
jgi:hypothetical protein